MTAVVDSACLYQSRTTHARLIPFRRRFTYSVMHILIDVDRVGAAAAGRALFRYNRFGLFSFYNRDHGDRSDAPLRPWAERIFADASIDLDNGPIRLLCFPRVLGFVFNPISLYFGYGPDGAPRGVIYEVNNTFGETHAYVAPLAGKGSRHEARKALHVSPFFEVRGDYAFQVRVPDARFSLLIENLVDGAVEHAASLTGVRRPMTDGALLAAFFRLPLMTLNVVAQIHWQAFLLWVRGARYKSKPAPPKKPVSVALDARKERPKRRYAA